MPRGYGRQDHERAEELRHEAQRLRDIAEAKRVPEQRQVVEREADRLDHEAELVVPLVHARSGWR